MDPKAVADVPPKAMEKTEDDPPKPDRPWVAA